MNSKLIKQLVVMVTIIFLSSEAMALNLDFGKITEGLDTLNAATGNISTEREIEIGEEMSAKLFGTLKLLKNDAVQNYVNNIGRWLAEQTKRRKELPWRFAVLDTTEINAFAAPGGHIFITKGLFMLLESEAELAGVLAHEIAHVLEKHHLDALQQGAQGELFTEILAQSGSKKDKEATRKLMGAGMGLYTRGLEKEDEFEADLFGVVIAARAGYDPYALLNVLTTLDSLNPKDENFTTMFDTHPPTGERLEALDKKMDKKLRKYAEQPIGEERFLKVLAPLVAAAE